MRERLLTASKSPDRLTHVSFFGAGGFLALVGNNGWSSEGLPAAQLDALKGLNAKRSSIRLATACPSGWVLVHDEHGATWQGAPEDLVQALRSASARGLRLHTVSVAPNGSWIIVGDGVDPGDPAVVR